MENVNLKVKIYLENETDKFMGIGVLWLLQKIKQFGSLRSAAADMGISYSKAFKMIENLEAALGVDVLERKKGGVQRAGASLTEFGEKFIVLYDNFQNTCKGLLDEPFKEFNIELKKLVAK